MREVAWVIFDEIHYMRDKGQFSTLFRSFSLHKMTDTVFN